jgi:diguanylate cyclase (GGDEF)-like protein
MPSSDLGATPTPGRSPLPADEMQAIRTLAIQVAAQVTLARAIEAVSSSLAVLLNAPIALLSKDLLSWRFEAHGFPEAATTGGLARFRRSETAEDLVKQLQEDSGYAWTAIALGTLGDRDWALLLPGQSSVWGERPGFQQLVENVALSLGQVANRELADYANQFQRGLHAFNRRLTRECGPGQLNSLVLKTLARQVRAQTGALALYLPAEDALAIVATTGYPLSIVEHLRIRPGEGLIGGVYKSGKAVVGDSGRGGGKRLRYRTDSYMLLPIVAGNERLGVIALTDRSDGRRFDARDFASARVMVSSAAAAFSRQRLHERLEKLTELATVDPVTGLFNRRYLETRLEAEVERARRQGQDLALLLIDIDDFKRVNDTRGHLEGDRILRDVADLLRAGVRIFDVCARYGGEEFVIVMPAASALVAQQVAERIRLRVERNFSNDSPAVTVSVGVGMLDSATTADELVDVADRALIAAKRAGKNLVWTGSDAVRRLP